MSYGGRDQSHPLQEPEGPQHLGLGEGGGTGVGGWGGWMRRPVHLAPAFLVLKRAVLYSIQNTQA